ncbi:hypothetical protein CPSG_00575 [Coccidioides posadasii str. Silveira]|uniref:Uncharacterized protein n=1 Tax=Coccidioides posadasii (strain RMSCC 757 / Silveira) TaxID=443226 RepID=E9CSL6_COCPS|nr:hypothetical protein CPSG_00575 [Coccidioides posadasii str. Silveira]
MERSPAPKPDQGQVFHTGHRNARVAGKQGGISEICLEQGIPGTWSPFHLNPNEKVMHRDPNVVFFRQGVSGDAVRCSAPIGRYTISLPSGLRFYRSHPQPWLLEDSHPIPCLVVGTRWSTTRPSVFLTKDGLNERRVSHAVVEASREGNRACAHCDFTYISHKSQGLAGSESRSSRQIQHIPDLKRRSSDPFATP